MPSLVPPPGAFSRETGWRQMGTFLVQTARPGFWATSLWFYLLPVGARHVFGGWTFWLGALRPDALGKMPSAAGETPTLPGTVAQVSP